MRSTRGSERTSTWRVSRKVAIWWALLASLVVTRAGAQEEVPVPLGGYGPAEGFVIAKGPQGELGISLWTYMRYYNSQGLDATYTDTFGRATHIDHRNDIQNQKVNLTLKGWIIDPRLHYRTFVWTSNPIQGDPGVVAVGGMLIWTFSRGLSLAGGAYSLPSTRSTQGTFWNWLKVDSRTIADEFFRASYTTAVWIDGQPIDGLKYRVMLGNNLSGFGIDADQLDDDLGTWAAAVWWMPTTHELGPLEGYGDFENHQKLATLVGLRFTRSREDSQSQPDPEDIENVQIRLSDGTNLFSAGAFAPDAQVLRATYRLLSTDVGLKYHGLSFDAEYFARWVDDFETRGVVPVSSLFDQGFQIQASAMPVQKRLQVYAAGSKILGEYGDPWDFSLGASFFPLKDKRFRVAGQALYLRNSPVGYSSLPFPLGGNGFTFTLDTEIAL